MRQFIHQLKTKKYFFPTLSLAVFVLAIFVVVTPAKADPLNTMGSVLVSLLSWLFMAFVNVMGTLLLKAIEILIRIANYGDFLNAPIVEKGWVVVRDVANIALVIALLYMAFATVFRKSSYQYQNLLPKLVVAAILINFSKTITGLIIDLGQVFMMTFVHAFQSAAAGNLTYGFGLHDLLAFRKAAGGGFGAGAGLEENINNWSIFGALVLGSLMVLVAFLVVLSLIIMLLFRILVLWFLVMFSPIAFMSGILPGEGGLSGYVQQWWQTLWKWVLVGPMVAFMLWLSLAVIQEMTDEKRIINLSLQSQAARQGGTITQGSGEWAAFANKMSGTQNIVDYLVTTGLLIMTLIVASKTGVAGASFAGTALTKMRGYADKAVRTAQKGAMGVAKLPTRPVGAAWRASKVPYMAQALSTRFKTSGTGRFLGLDKEYKEELATGRKAWAAKKVGGKTGAIRAFRYQQAQKALSDMKEKGMLEGGEEAQRNLLNDLLDKGKLKEAEAVMMNMAQSKDANLKTEDIENYEKAYEKAFKPKTGSQQEKDLLHFEETLMNSQKASGDTMAKYKFNVIRDSEGNLGRVVNRAKQVKKGFDDKKTADFYDEGLLKAFDESKQEFRAILDSLFEKKDFKSLKPEGREKWAKVTQRTIARAKELGLSDGEVERYKKLLEKLHARRFDKDTGEAILDPNYYGEGKKEDREAVEEGQRAFKAAISDSELEKVREEFSKKKIKKERDDVFYGNEVLTEHDKEIDKKVINPLTEEGEIQPLLYKLQSKVYEEDTDKAVEVYQELQDKIEEQVKQMDTEIIDPKTGDKHPPEKVFEKTKVGKIMKELSVLNNLTFDFGHLSNEEKEKIRHEVDILTYSAQRAAAGDKESIKIGNMEFVEDVGDIPQSWRVKSRKENKDRLSNVVRLSDTLLSSDMTIQERNKAIKRIEKEINKAVKHSKRYNADNKEFNSKLEDLHETAQAIKKGKEGVNLEELKNKAEVLLKQVDVE